MIATPVLNKILTGALVAQALLVAVIYWPRGDTKVESADLVPLDAATADRITIQGRTAVGEVPADPLVLTRKPTGWVVESESSYPADDTMMTEVVLAPLDLLVGHSPIATKDHSHAALDVAADQHSRKVIIESSEGTQTLYIGSSQGNAVHARVAGEPSVFRVKGLSAFGLPERGVYVYDRDFQKVAVDTVTALTIHRPGEPDIALTQGEEGWALQHPPPNTTVDQQKARDFVHATLNLRMMEPHGTVVTPEMGLDDRAVLVSWTTDDGGVSSTQSYRVGAEIQGESGRRFFQAQGSPFVLELLNGNLQHAVKRPAAEFLVASGSR